MIGILYGKAKLYLPVTILIKVIHIIFVPKCQGKVGHITHNNNQILSPSTT